MDDEHTLLLVKTEEKRSNNGLSLWLSVICVVDVFGVFPLVALPKAIIDCGFYGILIVFIVSSTQMYTASLLGRSWLLAETIFPTIKKKYRYPYAALAEVTFGKTLSNLVTFLLDLTVFGGGIPNLIVASQNLHLLGLRISDNTFNMSFCYWIIILGTVLCPILWIGSPKDMKLLCSLSVVIVFSVFLLILGSLLFGGSLESPVNPNEFPMETSLWRTMLIAYGIMSFQFDIHPTILTIQMDMNDKNKLTSAILGGFGVTLSLFIIVTTTAAIRYGNLIQPSILETLPTSPALHLAAILISLQLCLTSAISNSALYQHMEDCLSISKDFNHKRCILRTILTILAVVIAESVPRFDLVMSFIGGTLTGPLVFILPPLFYVKMVYLQQKHQKDLALESFNNIILNKENKSDLTRYREQKFQEDIVQINKFLCGEKFELGLCCLIVIASCLMFVATTWLNSVNSVVLSNFTTPCIYNITNSLLSIQ